MSEDTAPKPSISNSQPTPPEEEATFKPLEEISQDTEQQKAATELPSEETSNNERPVMIFEKDHADIKPILDTKKPSISAYRREKPKKQTPKARIEMPEEE